MKAMSAYSSRLLSISLVIIACALANVMADGCNNNCFEFAHWGWGPQAGTTDPFCHVYTPLKKAQEGFGVPNWWSLDGGDATKHAVIDVGVTTKLKERCAAECMWRCPDHSQTYNQEVTAFPIPDDSECVQVNVVNRYKCAVVDGG